MPAPLRQSIEALRAKSQLPDSPPDTRSGRWLYGIRRLIKNAMDHRINRNAAALAYYLLFAIFPLAIFISSLLAQLNLDVTSIDRTLNTLLPRDIVELITTYLDYIANTSSPVLMGFSLVFTIYFPMRAAGGLMDAVRMAYQMPKPAHPVSYRIRQFIFTIVFLIVIALTLILSTLGQRMVHFLIRWVPMLAQLHISIFLVRLWHYLRFVLVGCIMLATLGTLYVLSQDKRQPLRTMLPGVIAALIAWMALSIGFSFYVDHFANYSVIYGTLGAVIVLLLWLFMTAMILILGGELNAVIAEMRAFQKDS